MHVLYFNITLHQTGLIVRDLGRPDSYFQRGIKGRNGGFNVDLYLKTVFK